MICSPKTDPICDSSFTILSSLPTQFLSSHQDGRVYPKAGRFRRAPSRGGRNLGCDNPGAIDDIDSRQPNYVLYRNQDEYPI